MVFKKRETLLEQSQREKADLATEGFEETQSVVGEWKYEDGVTATSSPEIKAMWLEQYKANKAAWFAEIQEAEGE